MLLKNCFKLLLLLTVISFRREHIKTPYEKISFILYRKHMTIYLGEHINTPYEISFVYIYRKHVTILLAIYFQFIFINSMIVYENSLALL